MPLTRIVVVALSALVVLGCSNSSPEMRHRLGKSEMPIVTVPQ